MKEFGLLEFHSSQFHLLGQHDQKTHGHGQGHGSRSGLTDEQKELIKNIAIGVAAVAVAAGLIYLAQGQIAPSVLKAAPIPGDLDEEIYGIGANQYGNLYSTDLNGQPSKSTIRIKDVAERNGQPFEPLGDKVDDMPWSRTSGARPSRGDSWKGVDEPPPIAVDKATQRLIDNGQLKTLLSEDDIANYSKEVQVAEINPLTGKPTGKKRKQMSKSYETVIDEKNLFEVQYHQPDGSVKYLSPNANHLRNRLASIGLEHDLPPDRIREILKTTRPVYVEKNRFTGVDQVYNYRLKDIGLPEVPGFSEISIALNPEGTMISTVYPGGYFQNAIISASGDSHSGSLNARKLFRKRLEAIRGPVTDNSIIAPRLLEDFVTLANGERVYL